MRLSALRGVERLLIPLVVAGLMVGLSALGVAAARNSDEDRGAPPLIVRTEAGSVRGVQRDGYREFQGVRYAAPPVGALRFRPPQPAAPWRGIADATRPGAQCAQLNFPPDTNAETYGEDCLYVNVSTPSGGAAGDWPLPVLVWFHGGGWVYGRGDQFPGGPMAVQGEVVVVTVNFRLGPLGFLAQHDLSQQNGPVGSGSAALLDQQAALRWVQQNIARFGGDPRNVTISGESSGASAACLQMTSPSAKGLFSRAIVESYACPYRYTPLAAAEKQGDAVAAAAGCPDPATRAACLRTPGDGFVKRLLQAWSAAGLGLFPVGGSALPVQPAEAIASGKFNRVPILVGNNRDEMSMFTPMGPPPRSPDGFTSAQYEATLTQRYGALAKQVLAMYPVKSYSSPLRALAAVDSDATSPQANCVNLGAYDSIAKAGAPVFAYQFRDRTATPFIDLPGYDEGAEHAVALPYLWPGLGGVKLTGPQEELSRTMLRYWANFAAHGDPNGEDLPAWHRFHGAADVQGLDLTQAGGARPFDLAAESHCSFWKNVLGG
jgi:para-nitrobenzyl esterase